MLPAGELRSEFLMQLEAFLDPPQELGARRIFMMSGGTFAGPRLRGEIMAGGDWVLLRADGVAELDIRMTLRSAGGQLVYASCRGLFDVAPEIRTRIARGEDVDPGEYYFRTALVFETAAEELRWLNRLLAAGVGKRTAAGMVTDVFAIR